MLPNEHPSAARVVSLRWGGLAALLLSGCGGPQSALDPRGPQAERLYELYRVMTIGGAIILATVVTLMVVAISLPKTEHSDADERKPRRLKIVGAGAAATIVVLVALVVYSVVVSRGLYAKPTDPLRIRVVAHQWWWEIVYPNPAPDLAVRTANELHLPVGRPVEITVESRDVIHSFWVPSLHGKLDAIPGRSNTFWLQADVPGVYRGQCAEFCGLQHAKMAFLVVAERPPEFQRWLELQRAPARPPTDELGEEGHRVFLEASCSLCHTVRGTTAFASAGPDLTHLASRRTLAAGELRNNRGNLAGWILDPQHIKPGAFMPANDLEPAHLHALLRYLETLR